MNPCRRQAHRWPWLALVAALRPTARRRRRPHIGYVYPAGGQQGTTFEVRRRRPVPGRRRPRPHVSGGGRYGDGRQACHGR